jgi:Flp pilus assembly protein TadD
LAEAHQTLAQMLAADGDAAGARAAQAAADRLNQRTSDAQASAFALSVGRQKLKGGDRAAAIAQFREALRLAADNAQAHYALALALEASGAVSEARRHFAEAARLSPALRRPETSR